MEKSSVTVNLGGFSMVLFIVLLVLKLTEVIDWSWWWVTAPLWAGLALWVLVLVAVLLFAAVVGLFSVIGFFTERK